MRNATKHTVRVLRSGFPAALDFDALAMAQQTVKIIVLALAMTTAAATAQTIA